MATYYVDFSAANDGDGSAANQAASGGAAGAYKTIVGKTFTSGDTVWFRRAGTLTLAASLNLTVANVNYIGWPISTDDDYSGRPASGTSNGWDSDSTSALATIAWSGPGGSGYVITVGTNTGQVFKRLKFDQTSSASNTSTAFVVAIASSFKYCTFSSVQTGNNGLFAPTATSGTVSLISCTITGVGSTKLIFHSTACYLLVQDCTITKTAQSVLASSGAVNLSGTGGCLFLRNTVTVTTVGNVGCCALFIGAATLRTVIEDSTFDNGTCSTGSEYTVITLAGGLFTFRNCNIVGTGFQLAASSSGANAHQHFSKINQTKAMTAGGIVIQTTTVPMFLYVENFTAASGNTTQDVLITEYVQLVMLNASFAHATSKVAGIKNPGVLIGDFGGTVGTWQMWGLRGDAMTSNTTRTGGESFSVKMNMTDTTLPPFPVEVGFPGLETIWVALASGANTVTIYGAHKSYSAAPGKDDLWAEISYLDQASGASRLTATSREAANGTLTTDASSWTGDSGLTTFKLVLSITAGQACVCPVRLKLRKADAAGYVYLDPKPVVT